MLSDETLISMAALLAGVRGIVAVVLGGSRSRGEHTPTSDVDLGLYYDGEFDHHALSALARQFGGHSAAVTAPGAWGPWVDGGGWLTVDGIPVDWIYREIGRVEQSVEAARAGRTARFVQLGHPFGIPEYAYAAEVALCRILADPSGRLVSLKHDLTPYPMALAQALISELSAAEFTVGIARKALERQDSVYISGCLFESLIIAANAVQAAARQWTTNEKGLIASAGRLPAAPADFAMRSAQAIGELGTTRETLSASIDDVERIIGQVRSAIEHSAG